MMSCNLITIIILYVHLLLLSTVSVNLKSWQHMLFEFSIIQFLLIHLLSQYQCLVQLVNNVTFNETLCYRQQIFQEDWNYSRFVEMNLLWVIFICSTVMESIQIYFLHDFSWRKISFYLKKISHHTAQRHKVRNSVHYLKTQLYFNQNFYLLIRKILCILLSNLWNIIHFKYLKIVLLPSITQLKEICETPNFRFP